MSTEVDIKQLAIARDEEAPTASRRPRRHLFSRYVIPGALLAGLLTVVAWASKDVLLPPHDVWVVPVLASQSAAQSEGTPLFQAAGWIEPRPTPVRVAALAPGVVERLLVVEDQPVKAGEPIAELIKQDAQLACDRAAATLKLAEADVAEKDAGLEAAKTRLEQPVHLQAALGEANAALAEIATQLKNLPFETRRAEAQLEFANNDYERKRASSDAVSQRTVNEAATARETAAATVDELRARVESLAKQQQALTERRDALAKQLELLVDEKQEQAEHNAKCSAAAARLEQARVDLAEAKLRLDRMTVRAPIDGRIYKLVAFPGATLTGGMSPIAGADGSTVVTLYRPEMLQARVDVRFEDIPKVGLGQAVSINNPALAKPISGKVLFVSSEANIQKNTLEVKVAIDDATPRFKPEMLVEATFLAPKLAATALETAETRLYVPQSLLLHDDTGAYLWVADQSAGLARKTVVATGAAGAGGLVEIKSGITPGSRIIARGQESLADGSHIRVVGEEPASAAAAAPPAAAKPVMQRLPHGE